MFGFDAFSSEEQDFSPSQDLKIVTCGYDYIKQPQHWSRTRKDYYLIYVEKGLAKYCRNGETVAVKENEMFLYYPNEVQEICHDVSLGTAIIYFVHFMGEKADELMRKLNLKAGIILPQNGNSILNLYLKLVNEYVSKPQYYEITAKAVLTELLVQTARNSQETSQSDDCIYKAVMAIHANPNIQIKALAESYGYTVSYFIHLFKERTGKTPLNYKNKILLEKAQEYLTRTQMKISEIAEALGFGDDIYYFTNFFKSKTQLSPTKYREKYQ